MGSLEKDSKRRYLLALNNHLTKIRSRDMLNYIISGKDKLIRLTSLRRTMSLKGRGRNVRLRQNLCRILNIWGKLVQVVRRLLQVIIFRLVIPQCSKMGQHLRWPSRKNQYHKSLLGKGNSFMNRSSLREWRRPGRRSKEKMQCLRGVSQKLLGKLNSLKGLTHSVR